MGGTDKVAVHISEKNHTCRTGPPGAGGLHEEDKPSEGLGLQASGAHVQASQSALGNSHTTLPGCSLSSQAKQW